jgi:hypothetical protein
LFDFMWFSAGLYANSLRAMPPRIRQFVTNSVTNASELGIRLNRQRGIGRHSGHFGTLSPSKPVRSEAEADSWCDKPGERK